jgi:hypothetical protein
MNIPSAEYFEAFLDKIYHCKKPFEVKVRDRESLKQKWVPILHGVIG